MSISFLRPQFKNLGKGRYFLNPIYKLFGSNISVGDFPTFISAPDDYIQITSWDTGDWNGES